MTRSVAEIRQITISGLIDLRLVGAVVLGGAMTWLLSSAGIDARVNDLARLQNETFSLSWSAFPMLAGMVAPALIPIVLLMRGRTELAIKTGAAFFIALIMVSLLKGFTSRVHPEALEPSTSLLRSQAFRFGFLEDGLVSLIEGWPSGHTATNGAVGLTLARLTSNPSIRATSLLWVAWVALATVFGINGDVHWLSDTLAGGLIAWAISRRV